MGALKLTCITTTRESLAELAREIAVGLRNIDTCNSKKPLVVSVSGDMSSGKKIFSDMAVENLFDEKPEMYGKKDGDEKWSGKTRGEDFQVGFINTAWSKERYFSDEFNKRSQQMPFRRYWAMGRSFLRQLSGKGIAYIQNSQIFENTADVSIRIQKSLGHGPKRSGDPMLPGSGCQQTAAHGLLTVGGEAKAQFNEAQEKAGYTDWTRYVEITIRDKRIKNDPHFQTKITQLFFQASSDVTAEFQPRNIFQFMTKSFKDDWAIATKQAEVPILNIPEPVR